MNYAKLEDRSTLLMGRIAEMVDLEAGRMLDRIDGLQAMMMEMVEEIAYGKGLTEGMGVMALCVQDPERVVAQFPPRNEFLG